MVSLKTLDTDIQNKNLNSVVHFDTTEFNGWYISLSNIEFKHIRKYVEENNIKIFEVFMMIDGKSVGLRIDKYDWKGLKGKYKDSDIIRLAGFRKDSVCFHIY